MFIFLLLIINHTFAYKKNDFVRIIFYPTGLKNTSIIIYNGEDVHFSNSIIQGIRNASVYHFCRPEKERCEEGFYKIILTSNGIESEYEVFAKSVIYDVKKDKYLKYDFLYDFYAYLAKLQLEHMIVEKRTEDSSLNK